jgi:hypothetical protein
MTRKWPLLVKSKNRMSAADPMAGPSWFVADLVVIDPIEVAEIAEFDLLDIGEGWPLFPSVRTPFSRAFGSECLPTTCSMYQVFRFAKIPQAFHLGPTGLLGNNEGGQRTIV